MHDAAAAVAVAVAVAVAAVVGVRVAAGIAGVAVVLLLLLLLLLLLSPVLGDRIGRGAGWDGVGWGGTIGYRIWGQRRSGLGRGRAESNALIRLGTVFFFVFRGFFPVLVRDGAGGQAGDRALRERVA